jgi:hypothetical protein
MPPILIASYVFTIAEDITFYRSWLVPCVLSLICRATPRYLLDLLTYLLGRRRCEGAGEEVMFLSGQTNDLSFSISSIRMACRE